MRISTVRLKAAQKAAQMWRKIRHSTHTSKVARFRNKKGGSNLQPIAVWG
jgi:hypothetical protein